MEESAGKDATKEIAKALEECFWGDYTVSAEEATQKLSEGNTGFKKFIISRIIANSTCPSVRLLSIFSPDELKGFIPESSPVPHIHTRLRLLHSLLFKSIPGGVRPWKKQ